MAVRGRARAQPARAGSSACRVDADGQPALPARAADPRAAHPPGEGDAQHLHRAGAARGDGRRCTPSTTAPTGCATIARRVHRLAALLAAGLRAGGVEVAARRVLRHRAGRACPVARPSVVARPRAARASTCAASTPTPSAISTRRDDRRATHVARGVARRSACRRRATSTSSTTATPDADPGRRCCAHVDVPDPPGVPRAPLRDRDAALPAPAVRTATRARPRR